MICKKCKVELRPKSKSCWNCKEKVSFETAICKDCGKINYKDFKYCIECGNSSVIKQEPPKETIKPKEVILKECLNCFEQTDYNKEFCTHCSSNLKLMSDIQLKLKNGDTSEVSKLLEKMSNKSFFYNYTNISIYENNNDYNNAIKSAQSALEVLSSSHISKENDLKNKIEILKNKKLNSISKKEFVLEIALVKHKSSYISHDIPVAIDFGTTKSCATFYDTTRNESQIIKIDGTRDFIPTQIFYDKTQDRFYCGEDAFEKFRELNDDENYAENWKRELNSDLCYFEHSNKKYTSIELTSEFIKYIINTRHFKTHCKINDTNILKTALFTVPVKYFDEKEYIQNISKACKDAGLSRVIFLAEPVAGAWSEFRQIKDNEKFIVYDYGGGTFDLALIEKINGRPSIIATKGASMLGGINLNHYISEDIEKELGIDLMEYEKSSQKNYLFQEIMRFIERAKVKVSDEKTSETINITNKRYELTIDKLNEFSKKEVLKTIEMTKTLINDAGLKISDISKIIPIGGSSNLPLVQEELQKNFTKIPIVKVKYEREAVARGAAQYMAEEKVFG